MRTIPTRLQEFFAEHRVVTLAVVGPDGQPHAAAVFYAAGEGLALYFLTDPRTRHGQALRRCPRVAGTIQEDRQPWRRIRGVQLRGSCRPLAGAERDQGWQVYRRRYPFLRRPVRALASALRSAVLWKLELDWIRLIDNRCGFGAAVEWVATAPRVRGR